MKFSTLSKTIVASCKKQSIGTKTHFLNFHLYPKCTITTAITMATVINRTTTVTGNTVTSNILGGAAAAWGSDGVEVKVHCCSSGDSITTAQLSSTLSLSPCTNTALCNTGHVSNMSTNMLLSSGTGCEDSCTLALYTTC